MYITDVVLMNEIEIINYARKPMGEVWFLRVTTISGNWIPITKTAFRRIGTPQQTLIKLLSVMTEGRITTIMGEKATKQALWVFDADNPKGYNGGQGEVMTASQESLEEAFTMIWDNGVQCSLDNISSGGYFSMYDNHLEKDKRPPKVYQLSSSDSKTSAFFIKCVRVKVK